MRSISLDKNDDGPDHKLSADPSEMAELVRLGKIVASCIGSGEKTGGRRGNANRNSSVYHFNKAGSRWTNYRRIYVETTRPATGVPSAGYTDIVGKQARHDFEAGYRIQPAMFYDFHCR